MSLFRRAFEGLPYTPQKAKLALEAALRVSEIASSPVPLSDALRAMVGSAIDLLGADQGSIMLLEERERQLVLLAAAGTPGVPLGHRLPLGESVAGRVLATGKALRLGDVDQRAFVNFVPKSRAIRSSIVVPLRVAGHRIGVLNLAISSSAKLFTDEDVRVAQMFADQAAAVIHRASLHEKAELRSAGLLALVEASRGLLGTLELDALLEHAVDGATRLTGSKQSFICLFDPESGALSHGVFRALDRTAIRTVLEQPQVRAAIGKGELASLAVDGVGHVAAVAFRSSRGTPGVLVLTADPTTVEERADLLRAFAQQCGGALGAAELHSEVDRKESELSSIIQAVPNPIILVDSRDRILAANVAAEDLFSFSAVFSAGSPVEGNLNHEEVERLLCSEGNLQTEVTAGNPPRSYKARVADVRMPGAPMGRVLIMDDVTAEREIQQTQHDFVGIIGHELRTPLTIIRGFAKTLLNRIENATVTEAREALTTIDSKAVQLERLIEDLLYVSKIESKEASLRLEPVDVAQLSARVVEDVMRDHPNREVVFEIPGSLVWPCDETKVALVVRHLAENALKYSQAPEPVIVRATDENDELRVDVVDRGVGIVSSDIPHIFDRFRQVDASSTREHGGTGVGLYLCAQLVRVHDGRIWVESTWGKGSTFSFALPRGRPQTPVVSIRGKLAEQTGLRVDPLPEPFDPLEEFQADSPL